MSSGSDNKIAMKEALKQMIVRISERKHRRVKAEAARLGISMTGFIDRLIDEYFAKSTK